MATDLTVVLQNKPGTLADLGEATGGAGVNIDGMCGFATNGEGICHMLVEDAAAARKAVEQAGLEVRGERAVLLLRQGEDIVDRPGVLGEITRAMADAGVNVDLLYGMWDGTVVLGADDLERAAEAHRSWKARAF
jgi:hypothetical protein